MRAQSYTANANATVLTFQVLYVFYLEAHRLRRFCELSSRVISDFLGENDSTLSPAEILASTRQTVQPLATGCQPDVARFLQERLAKCQTNTEVLRCVHRFLRDQDYGPRQYLQASLRPGPLGRVGGMPGRRSLNAFWPCIPGMTRNGCPSKNKKNDPWCSTTQVRPRYCTLTWTGRSRAVATWSSKLPRRCRPRARGA